ncbi:MAG: PASTA domain-containing protein, partial [Micromonosporaceae bacterium]
AVPGRHAAPTALVPDEGRRRAASWALIGLGLLAVFALVALVTGLILSSNQPDVKVPDVKGKKVAEAEQTIRAAKLRPKQDTVFGNCAKGTVIKQNPAANIKVEENSTVNLTICKGPRPVTITDVTNMNKDDAEAALKKQKLVPEIIYKDGSEDEHQVISTDPSPGTQVDEGSKVKVYVSKGNMITVPNVVGSTQADAERLLREKGFAVTTVYRDKEDDEEAGKVVEQNPAGGQEAKTGATITIIVTRDPASSPSPTPSPSESPTVIPGSYSYDGRRHQ